MPSVSRATSTSDVRSVHSGTHSNGRRASVMQREENELAGGLEDWQDIDVADVDRYGFIIVKSPSTSSFADGTIKRSDNMRDPASLQRVATSLHLASETPRRKGTIKRTPSTTQHSRPTSNSSASMQQSVKRPTACAATRRRRNGGRAPSPGEERCIGGRRGVCQRPPSRGK